MSFLASVVTRIPWAYSGFLDGIAATAVSIDGKVVLEAPEETTNMNTSTSDHGFRIAYFKAQDITCHGPLTLFSHQRQAGNKNRDLGLSVCRLEFCILWTSLFGLLGSICVGSEPEVPTHYAHKVVDLSEDRPEKPYIKIVGDIDGDAKQDILVASAKGGGVVWYASPDWQRHSVATKGTFSEEGKLADIDRDGDLDAILPTHEGIFWFENALNDLNAVGNSQTLQWEKHFIGSDGANVHDLSVSDLDNDGDVEVIVRYEKELRRPLTVWWQESPADWTETKAFDHYGEGLGIGDIDGDGLKDLVINEICLKNSGQRQQWNPIRFASGMPDQLKVVCDDLNGDGRDEIVVSPQSRVPSGTSGKIACYFLRPNETHPLWDEVVLQQGAEEVNKVHGIAIGDMDLDGDLDITTSKRHDAMGTVEITIFYNLGGLGLAWKKAPIAQMGSHNHLVGDLDGDGDLDIVGANWNDEAVVEIWLAE